MVFFSICVNLRQSARASGALHPVVPVGNSDLVAALPPWVICGQIPFLLHAVGWKKG
jgi:hypothetical protein